jgi:hypothetical protein
MYIETERQTVLNDDGTTWKPSVPHKQFIRLVTELFDLKDYDPNNYSYGYQFYEYLMKNYPQELKKMKLHKDYLRYGIMEYDETNPNLVSNYKYLFIDNDQIKDPTRQFKTTLIKGFKYDPAIQTPGPLYQKAKELILKGIE